VCPTYFFFKKKTNEINVFMGRESSYALLYRRSHLERFASDPLLGAGVRELLGVARHMQPFLGRALLGHHGTGSSDTGTGTGTGSGTGSGTGTGGGTGGGKALSSGGILGADGGTAPSRGVIGAALDLIGGARDGAPGPGSALTPEQVHLAIATGLRTWTPPAGESPAPAFACVVVLQLGMAWHGLSMWCSMAYVFRGFLRC
jgi:hypothetical protein